MVALPLAATGHRRPAFLAGLTETSTSRGRAAGFVARLAAHGMALARREAGRFSYAGGREAAARLLVGPEPPDAIFCANDEMTLGVLDVAQAEFGQRVPEDLSVIGFDDMPSAVLAAHDVTTVAQDVIRLAEAAASCLKEGAAGTRRPPRIHRVPCRLVLRGSARRPPNGPEGSAGW